MYITHNLNVKIVLSVYRILFKNKFLIKINCLKTIFLIRQIQQLKIHFYNHTNYSIHRIVFRMTMDLNHR